jgi:hypothetical protein
MDEATHTTIDKQLSGLSAVIQDTQAALFMLTEQLKNATARRNELMALKNELNRPIPAPVKPENNEGDGDV